MHVGHLQHAVGYFPRPFQGYSGTFAPLTEDSADDDEQAANDVVASIEASGRTAFAKSVALEDAAAATGVRKRTDREGELRIVTIRDCDRSACGGTHVRSTGEIGPVLIRKLDRIRGNVRIEFLCGMRAVVRARTDYDALSRIAHARLYSGPASA